MRHSSRILPLKNVFVYTYLIINGNELALIDTGLPHFTAKILKTIRSLGFRDSNLKMILLTHSDGDHVGSADELQK